MTTPTTSLEGWRVPAALVALAAVPVIAGAARLHEHEELLTRARVAAAKRNGPSATPSRTRCTPSSRSPA